MEDTPQKRFIRLKDVENQVGFKRSKIQELASAGLFPKPIKLGTLKSPNAFDCRTNFWVQNEVDVWMAEKIEERDQKIN
jgi:predicted DNA-binding transcriptional regulator AlpA